MITRPILYPTISLTVAGISFTRPAILEKKGGVKIHKFKA
jgi:hypothetical protein